MIVFFTRTLVGRALAVLLALLAAFGAFRVWLSHHDATLLSGYVLRVEKTAAEAKANELERQRNAATQALEEYRKRSVADALTQQKLEAQLEEAIRNDNANPDDGDYRWRDSDRIWLCKQRGEANCSR